MQSLLCKLYRPAEVLTPVYVGLWVIKADEMGEVFRTHRRDEKYV
jgi:hypothetical protein